MSVFYPPLSLRDISPARGESACVGFRDFILSEIAAGLSVEFLCRINYSPPLRGRCPTGQRGVS